MTNVRFQNDTALVHALQRHSDLANGYVNTYGQTACRLFFVTDKNDSRFNSAYLLADQPATCLHCLGAT